MHRLRFLPVAALLVILALASAAQAAPVTSFFKAGLNQTSDEDRAFLIDRTFATMGAPGFGIKGEIDVGDSLRGSVNFNTLNAGGGNIGGITGNNEWTGVYQLLVATKACPAGPAGPCTFTFLPDPAFQLDIGGGIVVTGIPGDLPPGGGGAILVMFEDIPTVLVPNPPPAGPLTLSGNYTADFTDPTAGPTGLAALCDDGTLHCPPHGVPGPPHTPPSSADVSVGPYATEEAFVATAIDGTRFWTLGFTGGVPDGLGSPVPGPGEGFTLLTFFGDNILTAFGALSTTPIGALTAGMNRIGNAAVPAENPEIGDPVMLGVLPSPFVGASVPCAVPPLFLPCGTAQFTFGGGVLGVSNLDTSFEAKSDVNGAFNVLVKTPEASALLFLGAGALGLAGIGWRSSRRK